VYVPVVLQFEGAVILDETEIPLKQQRSALPSTLVLGVIRDAEAFELMAFVRLEHLC
jgi:hypothetical protein